MKDLTPLSADDIADAILYVITRPPHVCINEMLIMPNCASQCYCCKPGEGIRSYRSY